MCSHKEWGVESVARENMAEKWWACTLCTVRSAAPPSVCPVCSDASGYEELVQWVCHVCLDPNIAARGSMVCACGTPEPAPAAQGGNVHAAAAALALTARDAAQHAPTLQSQEVVHNHSLPPMPAPSSSSSIIPTVISAPTTRVHGPVQVGGPADLHSSPDAAQKPVRSRKPNVRLAEFIAPLKGSTDVSPTSAQPGLGVPHDDAAVACGIVRRPSKRTRPAQHPDAHELLAAPGGLELRAIPRVRAGAGAAAAPAPGASLGAGAQASVLNALPSARHFDSEDASLSAMLATKASTPLLKGSKRPRPPDPVERPPSALLAGPLLVSGPPPVASVSTGAPLVGCAPARTSRLKAIGSSPVAAMLPPSDAQSQAGSGIPPAVASRIMPTPTHTYHWSVYSIVCPVHPKSGTGVQLASRTITEGVMTDDTELDDTDYAVLSDLSQEMRAAFSSARSGDGGPPFKAGASSFSMDFIVDVSQVTDHDFCTYRDMGGDRDRQHVRECVGSDALRAIYPAYGDPESYPAWAPVVLHAKDRAAVYSGAVFASAEAGPNADSCMLGGSQQPMSGVSSGVSSSPSRAFPAPSFSALPGLCVPIDYTSLHLMRQGEAQLKLSKLSSAAKVAGEPSATLKLLPAGAPASSLSLAAYRTGRPVYMQLTVLRYEGAGCGSPAEAVARAEGEWARRGKWMAPPHPPIKCTPPRRSSQARQLGMDSMSAVPNIPQLQFSLPALPASLPAPPVPSMGLASLVFSMGDIQNQGGIPNATTHVDVSGGKFFPALSEVFSCLTESRMSGLLPREKSLRLPGYPLVPPPAPSLPAVPSRPAPSPPVSAPLLPALPISPHVCASELKTSTLSPVVPALPGLKPLVPGFTDVSGFNHTKPSGLVSLTSEALPRDSIHGKPTREESSSGSSLLGGAKGRTGLKRLHHASTDSPPSPKTGAQSGPPGKRAKDDASPGGARGVGLPDSERCAKQEPRFSHPPPIWGPRLPRGSCAKCEKAKADMRCGACRAVYYCDKTCRNLDWEEHEPNCKSVRDMDSLTRVVSHIPGNRGVKASRSIHHIQDSDDEDGVMDVTPGPHTFSTLASKWKASADAISVHDSDEDALIRPTNWKVSHQPNRLVHRGILVSRKHSPGRIVATGIKPFGEPESQKSPFLLSLPGALPPVLPPPAPVAQAPPPRVDAEECALCYHLIAPHPEAVRSGYRFACCPPSGAAGFCAVCLDNPGMVKRPLIECLGCLKTIEGKAAVLLVQDAKFSCTKSLPDSSDWTGLTGVSVGASGIGTVSVHLTDLAHTNAILNKAHVRAPGTSSAGNVTSNFSAQVQCTCGSMMPSPGRVPCPSCHAVYYCSSVCAKDAAMQHRKTCNGAGLGAGVGVGAPPAPPPAARSVTMRGQNRRGRGR